MINLCCVLPGRGGANWWGRGLIIGRQWHNKYSTSHLNADFMRFCEFGSCFRIEQAIYCIESCIFDGHLKWLFRFIVCVCVSNFTIIALIFIKLTLFCIVRFNLLDYFYIRQHSFPLRFVRNAKFLVFSTFHNQIRRIKLEKYFPKRW